MTTQNTATCGDCDKVSLVDDLDEYRDFWSRIDVGGVIPAGDCPKCGAFAYLDVPPTEIRVYVTGGVAQDVQNVPPGVDVTIYDADCEGCDNTHGTAQDIDGDHIHVIPHGRGSEPCG